jgi:DNA polymerase I-like protein with 3'-5' exonuclease and polymerase domains
MRLQDVFGWVPKKFGSTGKPTVDESVLEEIPEAVMPEEVRKLILNFFVVNKTLGMVANGKNAWLNLMTPEGRIHGRMDPLGTITGRGAHSKPNLGQVISVKKKKVILEDGTKVEVVILGLEGGFGAEARSLFLADEGDELTGVDMSSLELILMGHYLFPKDEGAFSARVCDPTRDAHQEHADIADVTRADAKTTIYLIIYGGTAYKLSLDPAIIVTPEEIPELLTYRGLPMILSALAKRFDPTFVNSLDDMQRARISKSRQIIVKLSSGITGLQELTEDIKRAAEKGHLRGLDGRKVYVRKAYSAFNAILQSGGAQVCKMWIVRFKERMEALGYIWRKDFKFRLWVHDEFQCSHTPGLGPVIKEQAELAARDVAAMLNLRGMLRTDGKTGMSWFDTH